MSSMAPHYQAKSFRWWHDHIIDDMLANPFDTIAVRAKRLGYTPAWLHTLTKSDMFAAAYAARKGALNDQLRDSMVMKMGKVADKHLEIMLEQLETKRTNIPFADIAASTNNVLERLGFGSPKATHVVNVQQNAIGGMVVSAELLSEAREKLRANEAKLAIESTPTPSIQDLVDPDGGSGDA